MDRLQLTRLMPYDLYERHSVVMRLLEDRPIDNVLDVGGRAGLLGRFADYDVVALNVDGSGNVQFGGHGFPFRNCGFSAVVSIDTLEHLPRERRQAFLRECLRVSTGYVVVAAPFGSPDHVASERRIDALYRDVYGHGHVYLEEHIRYGLPTAAELEGLVAGFGAVRHRIYFAGDYVWQAKQFERVWLDKPSSAAANRI